MIDPINVEFEHNGSKYKAAVDNQSDALDIHHVTTRCGVPFVRRMWPSATPGRGVDTLIEKAMLAATDAVLDGAFA